MGSSSSEQTVGYKYYTGLHFVLSLGPIDKIVRIVAGEKTAWAGSQTAGSISINQPDLFGGESREGGIVGTVDFADGSPTQGQNSYLVSKLGALVPAFRGVASAICRQVYIGLNPYPKKWEFWAQRTQKTGINGDEMWQISTAKIPIIVVDGLSDTIRVAFVIDTSDSMGDLLYGSLSRLDAVKADIIEVLAWLRTKCTQTTVDLYIVPFDSAQGEIQYYGANESQIDAAISFVSGLTPHDATSPGITPGVIMLGIIIDVNDFFGVSGGTHRKFILVSDGEISTDSDMYAAYQNAQVMINSSGDARVDIHVIDIADSTNTYHFGPFDNTPIDGVPVLSSAEDRYIQSIFGLNSTDAIDIQALNFVHHIRETYTDPDWGAGIAESEIDADTWEAAATTAYTEGLGCCYYWDRKNQVDEYRKFLIKHIDAVTPVSRSTGKILFKLIRDDYDHDNIPTLTPDKIISITPTARQALGERTTSVTATYWNCKTGKNATLTVSNPAIAMQQGVDINKAVTYDAFPTSSLASRAAQRDLLAYSSDLQAFTIECWIDDIDAYYQSIGEEFNQGSVFRLSFPDFDIDGDIVRVTAINFGDGKWRKNKVRLECIQDVFSLSDAPIIADSDSLWTDPISEPVALTEQLSFEVPYIELVQRMGQSTIDAKITEEPDIGYVGVACGRPESSMINGRVYTSSLISSDYSPVGVVDFCPTFTLNADIGRFDTTLSVTAGDDVDELIIPSWAQIGDELIWISAYDSGAGEITAIRGIYDTLPTVHYADDILYCWDNYIAGSQTEYVSGETIYSKIATVSGKGELPVYIAEPMATLFDGRANAPYRPANVTVDGIVDYGTVAGGDVPVTVTWVDRNRLLETTDAAPLAWTDSGITPETNTQYQITYYSEDATGALTQYAQTSLGYVLTADINAYTAGTIPSDAISIFAKLETIRDGVISWRGVNIPFEYVPIVSVITSGVVLDAVVSAGTQDCSVVTSGVVLDMQSSTELISKINAGVVLDPV